MATAAVSSVCPSHVAQCEIDLVTTAGAVVVDDVEVTELVLAAVVLAAVVLTAVVLAAVVLETGALDALELDPVEAAVVEELVLVVVAGVLELRSTTPLLLPVSAACVAVDDAPESDPSDPQADSTTQHASATTPCPGKRCIERLGKKIEVAAFSPGIDSGHNVLELRLRVCMYQPGPIKHKPKIAIFGRAILDGVGEVCRSKRDTRQRRTLDRQVGSRCPGREAPAARHLFELTHRNGRARCAAKIAFV